MMLTTCFACGLNALNNFGPCDAHAKETPMTNLVPQADIENIVGAHRHPNTHLARGVDNTVYILHPDTCIDMHEDLRDCPYSHALDRGIRDPEAGMWQRRWGLPVTVRLEKGRLIPHLAATAPGTPPIQLVGGANHRVSR